MKSLFLVILAVFSFQQVSAQAEYGKAVPYSDKFQGSKTASGEKYDRNSLTASHRTLPLGTKVRMTNVKNNQSVIVRINDSGPFIKGIVSNISKKAAETIGLPASGGNVKLELLVKKQPKSKVIEKPAVSNKPAPTPVLKKPAVTEKPNTLYKVQVTEIPQSQYGLQIGKYDNYENLLKKVAEIQTTFFKNVLVYTQKKADGDSSYKLIIGPFPEEKTANSFKENAAKKGISGFVVDLRKL